MKTLLLAFATATFLMMSCTTSKDYLLRVNEDKTMFDIIKKLNRKTDDTDATRAIKQVYAAVQEIHLKKIDFYTNQQGTGKWDKLMYEYGVLQNMHDAIINSDGASRLFTPVNYSREIADIKNSAAEHYYQTGNNYYATGSRVDAKRAYEAYKKATNLVRDYKDTRAKMKEAYNGSIVDVVINTIQDNSYYYNTYQPNMRNNYSNENFQQSLVNDLGGRYATLYPARFYMDWEVARQNIQPTWVVNLVLRNMDMPRPVSSNYSRNVSKQITIGTDTAGRAIYKTIYATINVQRISFNARAQMDVNITDVATRRNIAYNTYSDTYNWQNETATYSGDSRALSSNDVAILNNNNYSQPNRDFILNELYRNIYPQIKNFISNEVRW